MRPEGALLSSPRGSAFGPTISFLKKETVPPGGTREKSSGVLMLSAPPEAKKHPRHPRSARGRRPHPAKIPRPKRRGLRGTMVPFPAALCAAGTPMGWTLVAPFLELPPSCAALAALANRARPAMRCRTAFPQKCRDLGPPQKRSFCAVGAALPPTALLGRAARAASDAGSPKVGRPESNK